MFKNLRKSRKEEEPEIHDEQNPQNPQSQQDDVLVEEVEYMAVTPIRTFADMTDEEILAQADQIRARVQQAEQRKHQEAIQNEQMKYYQRAAEQDNMFTRARRASTYTDAQQYLVKLDAAIGDRLPHEMKCVLAALFVRAFPNPSGSPNNHQALIAITDFFEEEAIRKAAGTGK